MLSKWEMQFPEKPAPSEGFSADLSYYFETGTHRRSRAAFAGTGSFGLGLIGFCYFRRRRNA